MMGFKVGRLESVWVETIYMRGNGMELNQNVFALGVRIGNIYVYKYKYMYVVVVVDDAERKDCVCGYRPP